jgi:hypothetical protein
MSPEAQEYLEREYSEFEEAHLRGECFWRAPVSELKDTALFPLFEQLVESFPDHPSEHSTLFYLIESSSGNQTILVVCTHFEHGSLNDVRGLLDLFERHAAYLVRDGSVERIALDLLDHSREQLHVRLYDPTPEIVRILKQHATRKPA